MAFPPDWPPAPCSGRRTFRFFRTGNVTSDFADNAFLFAADDGMAMPLVRPGQPNSAAGDYGSGGAMDGGPGNVGAVAIDKPTVLPPPPTGSGFVYTNAIRIFNDGSADLLFSFDGTNIHGVVKAGQSLHYWNRYEAGIALKGSGGYRIEAW